MSSQQRRSSTLLQVEAEAADYFNLDLDQVSLFTSRSSNDLISATLNDHHHHHHHHPYPSSSDKMAPTSLTNNTNKQRQSCKKQTPTKGRTKTISKTNERSPTNQNKSPKLLVHQTDKSKARKAEQHKQWKSNSTSGSKSPAAPTASGLVCSSPSSTNSLPSISSSPSVSPSLVCPHLSLDDLLTQTRPSNSSVSPHTIGLCSRCRLDPPPNVHSPLSPVFKPTVAQSGQQTKQSSQQQQQHTKISPANEGDNNFMAHCKMTTMRRVHSDHQASDYSKRKSCIRLRPQQARDDSLDYYLNPDELRRLQMSPTLRNSVEFIRKNSIESGRVVRIYKNGQPYDRPLRVCILRGEFATLNHLLDHINGRQLIPLGARFLFHLDGQLVYSVHELKHGSIYIVSGVRTFDYRANSLLKEMHKREQIAPQNALNRRHLHSINQVDQSRERFTSPKKFTMINQTDEDQLAKGQTLTASNPMGSRQTRVSKQAIKTTSPTKVRNYNKQPGETLGWSTSNDLNLSNENERHPQAMQETMTTTTTSRLTRAKSDMGDLPNKRKKNVTFMDTGRGSSPTIADLASSRDTTTDGRQCEPMGANDARQNQIEKPINESIIKELNTNEIGIQVSDSIDGFLIDLPMPMPAKGDDSNLRNGRVGAAAGATRPSTIHNRRLQRKTTNGRDANKTAANETKGPATINRIVTITERQLSLDEMSKFKELSHGDHHNELGQPEIKIHLDNSVVREDDDDDDEEDLTPIVMADEPSTMSATKEDHPSGSNTDVSLAHQLAGGSDEQTANRADHWQYPAGRESSATPTERPVSQSGPNETVRARVTTPSPSLSTLGDNNSVSMSLDQQQQQQPVVGAAGAAQGRPDEQNETNRLLARHVSEAKQNNRQQVDLMGELCPGIEPPDKNFKLVWVNGFLINDLYPENCANPAQQLGSSSPTNKPRGESSQTSPEPGAGGGGGGGGSNVEAHLSPKYVAPSPTPAPNQPILFKSSERFHNWICYSQRYDELVYPAGSLIVLWCKWTEAQRYYSKHKSNVSSLVLSTLDSRLAGSAQVTDTSQKPQVSAQIHLWSLETLETLLIVDNDQFRNKRIFSLRLKNAPSIGCELTVAARDDKQLYLFSIKRRLKSDLQDSFEPDKRQNKKSRYQTDSTLLKTTKVLQNNQHPLIVMSMPLNDQHQLATTASETIKKSASKQTALGTEPNNQLLLSFGRRHFNLWLVDKRQSKLRPMQAENKSAKFVEMIIKANCLVKLEPKELLIGDSDGNLALILLDYKSSHQQQQQQKQKQPIKFPLTQQNEVPNELKYGIKTITLLDPNESTPRLSPIAITCLTRITGTLFMTADSQCSLKFWQIKREKTNTSDLFRTIKLQSEEQFVSCQQIGSIHLPADLGLICTIILAKYDRRMSMVEFYVISTSNTILFGTTKLLLKDKLTAMDNKMQMESKQKDDNTMINNTTLSVVYEGHETAATCLVADVASNRSKLRRKSLQLGIINSSLPDNCFYFTCSLDSRICKWNGHKLVWKSLLPSPCASLAIHPTGFVLAVGSTDGTVYILDKVSGLLVSYFPLTPVRINCLAYSRDGLLLAAGCANGSIFILPVYERGLIYKKVSIFQSPYAVVSLQFSTDNRYMLTSVTHGSYQELLLWDLPNFRYMRDNVKLAADKIQWFDSICSGSEDVRAIWENANLATSASPGELDQTIASKKSPKRTLEPRGQGEFMVKPATIVNLSCHRLVLQEAKTNNDNDNGGSNGDHDKRARGYVIASDTSGHLRLFRYPCYDIQQGFYAVRISSTPVNCCRFLNSQDEPNFISSSIDGSICLWKLQ